MNSLEPDASDAQTRTIDAGWLAVAMREAQSMRHGYVGTEHLLLALLLEEGGGARATLEAHGLHAEPLRAELRRMPAEPAFDPLARLPLTPRTREALEAAVDSARSTQSGRLRSEHLLIAILEQEDGLARRALSRFAIDLEACAKTAAARILEAESAQADDSVLLEAEIPALVAYGEVVRDSSGIDVLQPDFVDRVFETLGRRDRCAALLIGAPSSGKSATARVLAERLARDLDKRMIAISPATLVAGARHRGKLEDRIRAVFDQANRDRGCVLFIDDIEDLTVWREVADALELALSRHHAPLLATTTPRGIETLESLAPTLLAKFEQVAIPARGPETESRLVTALAPALAAHHGISIDAAAIATALRLSRAPRVARAIELLDLACAARRARTCRPNETARAAFQESVRLAREAEISSAEGDESTAREKLERSRRSWKLGLAENQATDLPALSTPEIETAAERLASHALQHEMGHVRTTP